LNPRPLDSKSIALVSHNFFKIFGTYLERKIVNNTETLVMVVKSQKDQKSLKSGETTEVTGVPEEGVEPTLTVK